MGNSPEHCLAVTGSTGMLGGLVASELADAGVSQRLLVRNPDKAPKIPRSTIHACAYADEDAAAAALTGSDVLFMVSAAESSERLDEHRKFIDAAATAGIQHVVYTSFLGAAPDATFTLARDHWRTEEHLKASGMEYTFLRNSFYMDFIKSMVGEDLTIRGPAGDGRCSFVSRADIARTAAKILQSPGKHTGQTYDLTGPEALTMHEVASILGSAQGQRIAYRKETTAEAYESRQKWNPEDWQADAWVSTYTAIRNGEMAIVSTDIETLTGVPPMSFRSFSGT